MNISRALKRIAIIGAIIMSLFCLAGCKVPYNAEIVCDSYNNSGEWLNEDVKNQSCVAPVGYAATADCPKSRTFVIKSEEEKCNILNGSFDVEVNFEQEMLIVYTWSSAERRPCYFKSMELKDDILYINFYVESLPLGHGGSCMPYQRWFVIKLDLLSITSVEIKEL